MDTPLSSLLTELHQMADGKIANHSQRFFKTDKGEYGEGDRFIGVRVPVIRKIAAQGNHLAITDLQQVLSSTIHEERLLALIIMVQQYKRGDERKRMALFQLYIDNTAYINNWDLVDTSAPYIVGPSLEKKERTILHQWAQSTNVWERRMAIMATFHFIRNLEFDETLQLAQKLLNDQHDLIHKAVGWMLREIGNRNRPCEESFLRRHYHAMPRTMLRYAIEKFETPTRKKYLRGEV